MSDVNILIADNDRDALAITSEYLQSAGYTVLTASSVADARNILNTNRVHLAIIDLRLTDDSESDRSGLLLSQEVARSTPKLILTKWPAFQDAREALKLDDKTLPPAVDFLDKKDGLEKLGMAVKQALLKYVRINRNLVIQTDDAHPISFLNLIELLSPALSADMLQNAAAELDDLFRRLFYEKNQIRIDRLLWQRDGRAALIVFAFAEGHTPESLIVICGKKMKMEEEASRYRRFAPPAPGHKGTVLTHVNETEHFAAHAYALAGSDLEDGMSLEELYRTAPDRVLNLAFTNLFEETLTEWHEGKLVPVEGKSLAELYSNLLGLPAMDELRKVLDARIDTIARQIPALGPEIRRVDGRLTINFGAEKFTFPDPASHLVRLCKEKGPQLLMTTPGMVLGSSVLADRKGKTWVTDFASAGLAPTLWNYVSLEAVVRFDLTESSHLRWLYDLELLLVGPEFTKLYATEIEAPLRKNVRAIQHIRRLGARLVVRQQTAYHIGVLFQAIRRLADYEPTLQLTSNELTRLGHLLFATAIILNRLLASQNNSDGGQTRDNEGIQIDHINKAVWIDGGRVQVRGQSYDLLHELYVHANELCSRASIVERVFGEKYEETNEGQVSRLNTAVRRLREKIEEDPDHPLFLLTEPHGGYKLIPRPG